MAEKPAPSSRGCNRDVTRICAGCGASFHPLIYREETQRYCSAACSRKAGLATMHSKPRPATTRPPQQCLFCGRTYTPARARQQFCSPDCARGHALSRINPNNSHGEAANAKRREHVLRRAEEGNPLRRTGASTGKTAATPPPRRSAIKAITRTSGTPDIPDMSNMSNDMLTALETLGADMAEETTTPPATSDQEGHPLTWPLQGVAAREEWQRNGDLREAQADRRLQQEAGQRGGAEGRTIVLSGMGSYLGVEGTALVCHQGRTHGAPAPARELLYPALHDVKAIYWIGGVGYQGGTLTLPAASWCRREGISLTVLDGSGEALLETLPGERHDAELHRRQYLISSGYVKEPSVGAVVRALVQRKTEAQYQMLATHPDLPGAAEALRVFGDWCLWLNLSDPPPWQHDVNHMRRVEGKLASIYWRSWEGWPLKWARSDLRRIPPHWLSARSRLSPLSPQGNARHSVDPLNSAINYVIGCLVSQCRQSLLTEGFDLACGFLHLDKPGRDSLTWDICELERGTVEGLVIDLLGRTTLHYGDFARSSDGGIMVHPQLARLLVASCRVAQSRINSHARWLRRFLMTGNAREDGPAEAPDEVNG